LKQFDNAAAILDQVFVSDIAQAEMSSEVTGDSQFLVIPGQQGPRWIVPSYASLGKSVLTQWQPYNFISKLKWKGLLFIYTLGELGKVPGIGTIDVGSRASLPIPKMEFSLVPIVYVGTPGPQQKAVVTLVSPDSGKPQAIMKVALGDCAQASLLREAIILKKLADTDIPALPALLAVEEDYSRTWQTVIDGRLTSRKLTQEHIDWLLQLPRSEKTTTLSEQLQLFQQSLKLQKTPWSNQQKQAVSSATKLIQGEHVLPLVLVHGDFTPWNLKFQKDQRIGAIDWEDAQFEGLPLWDLCHFFLMQAHLFKEKNPIKKMAASPLVQRYLMKMGVNKKEFISLVLLYILLTVCSRKSVCSQAYKEFLLWHINMVVMV